jgi:hypothetical protein
VFHALGDVDELNSAIGVAQEFCSEGQRELQQQVREKAPEQCCQNVKYTVRVSVLFVYSCISSRPHLPLMCATRTWRLPCSMGCPKHTPAANTPRPNHTHSTSKQQALFLCTRCLLPLFMCLVGGDHVPAAGRWVCSRHPH